MTSPQDHARDAASQAQEAAGRAAGTTAADRLARLGIATRGAVYLVVAWLAIRIATGNGDQQANRQGALGAIRAQPLGVVLLVVLAAGFAGYAAYRLLEAITGRGSGRGARGVGQRVASLASAVFYGVLSVTTIAFAVTADEKSPDARQQGWTARLLAEPGGRLVIAAAGLAVVGVGIATVVAAVRRRFTDDLDMGRMPGALRRATPAIGIAGQGARAAIAVLIGGFLVKAAADVDPQQSRGLDQTLRTLAGQPYGPVLLLAVALGMVAFALLSFVQAGYERL